MTRNLLQILIWFTLFLSAALLFWVEPMFGKMVLPLLGGSSAVWNTCLVFYQASLLVGYLYAHAQGKFFSLKQQMIVHVLLVGFSVLSLPVAIPCGWTPPAIDNPIPWLLLLLTVSVGFPFVMLSATAPLLQNWFAGSGKPGSKDPYFLYAASNLGSLAGLLGYPFLLERHLSLVEQSRAWSATYVVLLLCVVCAAAFMRGGSNPGVAVEANPSASPGALRRLHWLLLAAVPSSLLQSVTTYITTDLASVPLLWVIPLAIYLVSFVLVFSRRTLIPHAWMVRAQPLVLLTLVTVVFWWEQEEFWYLFPLNLLTLFVTAMVCHGELVRLRPNTKHLTEFYLWMAFGGVIGGIFNAIVAPLIFDSLVEYPVAIALSAFLLPSLNPGDEKWYSSRLDIVLPLIVGLILFAGVWAARPWFHIEIDSSRRLVVACTAGAFIYLFCRRSLRFGISFAALIGASFFCTSLDFRLDDVPLHTKRSFFGIIKVTLNEQDREVVLINNTTVHGSQSTEPERTCEPLSYYSRHGPLGDAFKCLPPAPNGRRVAVVGLGAGAMAAYSEERDHWVFYEINPEVQRVACNRRYFSYLSRCKAKVDLVLGDARISFTKAPALFYDVIVLDAFSGDSVPVHLLTREALKLYLSKLAPGGRIMFHVSNQYLHLDAVVKSVALDAGLAGLAREDYEISDEAKESGAMPSHWVVLARSKDDLTTLSCRAGWCDLTSGGKTVRVWTDDYSNLVQCLYIDLK